jgi:hypothetical protein
MNNASKGRKALEVNVEDYSSLQQNCLRRQASIPGCTLILESFGCSSFATTRLKWGVRIYDSVLVPNTVEASQYRNQFNS